MKHGVNLCKRRTNKNICARCCCCYYNEKPMEMNGTFRQQVKKKRKLSNWTHPIKTQKIGTKNRDKKNSLPLALPSIQIDPKTF